MTELQSSLPLVDLGTGDQVVVQAVDPVTGAVVSGVTFSVVAITYEPGTAASEAPPPDVFLAHLPTS
jgi:hypothetical protein